METNKLYLEAKKFLDNFSLDFDKLAKELKKILKLNFSMLGIDKKMTISFDESKLFGKSGSVSKTNISFNKTRIEMLLDLKIDDTSLNHLKSVEKFYSHYNKSQNHSIFEENLYDFIKKYKEMDAEWAFEFMGSYKTIKYEILSTILHEAEHVYQDEFKKYLHEEQFPSDIRSIVLIFTSVFNTIFESLHKKGVQLDYIRENHIFPIEFDARYQSLKQLSEIKTLYFQDDKDFSSFLFKSNIIPKGFDAVSTSKQIFSDYQQFYKLYKKNFGNEYEKTNQFIKSNKKLLIKEFARRYKEMEEISLANAKF